jgi:hypothetical protein
MLLCFFLCKKERIIQFTSIHWRFHNEELNIIFFVELIIYYLKCIVYVWNLIPKVSQVLFTSLSFSFCLLWLFLWLNHFKAILWFLVNVLTCGWRERNIKEWLPKKTSKEKHFLGSLDVWDSFICQFRGTKEPLKFNFPGYTWVKLKLLSTFGRWFW